MPKVIVLDRKDEGIFVVCLKEGKKAIVPPSRKAPNASLGSLLKLSTSPTTRFLSSLFSLSQDRFTRKAAAPKPTTVVPVEARDWEEVSSRLS